MSMKNLILKENAVVTFTGGDPLQFAESMANTGNGLNLVCVSDVVAAQRRQIIAKVRPSVTDKNGKQSKQKKSLLLVVPHKLEDGVTVVYNTWRIEEEIHPMFSDADATRSRMLATECLAGVGTDSCASFWTTGTP